MTVAYVKNSDGSGGLVQNTFRDDAGVLHTLGLYYTSDGIIYHQVFFDYLMLMEIMSGLLE